MNTSQQNPWKTFDLFELPRLFLRVLLDQETGIAHVAHESEQWSIWFRQGEPVYIHTNVASIKSFVQESQRKSNALDHYLLGNGQISPEEWSSILREEGQKFLARMFLWESGYFFWEERPVEPGVGVSWGNPGGGWIISGIHQISPKSLVEAGFKPECVFRRKEGEHPSSKSSVLWTESVAKVSQLIDGQRSMEEILTQSGMESSEVLKDLFFLVVSENVDFKPTKAGPFVIEPEADFRVEVSEDLIASSPGNAGEITMEFKPTPAKTSPSHHAPEILGEVEVLEQAYQLKKKPEAEEKNEDPAPKKSETAAGEITLDPKQIARLRSAKPEPTPVIKPPPLQEELKVAPKPVPKVQPVPKKTEVQNIEVGGRGALSFLMGLLRVLFSFLIAFLVLGAAIWFLLYRYPLEAQNWFERIRLQQMVGRTTLDSKRLGKFYLDEGQLGKAKRAFEKGLKENPRDFEVQLHLAKVQMLLGEWEPALKNFQSVVDKNPTLGEAHLGLGWCYLRIGQPALARRAFVDYLNYSAETPEKERVRTLVRTLPALD